MEEQFKKSFVQIKDELSKQISEPLPPPVSSYPTIEAESVQLSTRQPSEKKRYLFEQVHKLSEGHYSEREIARHLQMSRGAVRKYKSFNEPQGRKLSFRNDYSIFLPIVQ